jgi:flagellar protein FlbT
MSNLVLEIKQGEMMVVNGAAIRFRTKTRIELTSRARFLFGKQLMAAAEATTPARSLYYALQTAYVGNDDERGPALERARDIARCCAQSSGSATVGRALDVLIEAANADRFYAGLKVARRLVRYEDALAEGRVTAEDELADTQ